MIKFSTFIVNAVIKLCCTTNNDNLIYFENLQWRDIWLHNTNLSKIVPRSHIFRPTAMEHKICKCGFCLTEDYSSSSYAIQMLFQAVIGLSSVTNTREGEHYENPYPTKYYIIFKVKSFYIKSNFVLPVNDHTCGSYLLHFLHEGSCFFCAVCKSSNTITLDTTFCS